MDSLKDKLINVARAKGICQEGFRRLLESSDIDAMVDYYVANPDWCLERDFPTLQMLRDHFPDAGNLGVFVDRVFHGEVLNERQAYVFHNCRGTIKVGLNVERAIIPMLYVANGCRLRIVGVEPGDRTNMTNKTNGANKANGPVRVPVAVFGRNDVSARDNRWVEFNVYKNELL